MQERVREKIEGLRLQFQQEINGASDFEAVEKLRIRFLGKKGEVTALMRGMSQFSPEERPLLGKLLNEFKSSAEQMLENRKNQLKEKETFLRWEKEHLDITLPGKSFSLGGKHPLTLIAEEVVGIFSCMGF